MDKTTAANAIRKLAIQYAAMSEAADALEAIGSLELVEKETRARIDKARAEEAKAVADAEAARGTAREVDLAAERVMADARSSADALRKEAEQSALKMLEDAETKARVVADAAQAKANAAVDTARQRVADLERAYSEGSEAVAKVKDDLAVKTSELTSINTQIADVKAQLRSFVKA